MSKNSMVLLRIAGSIVGLLAGAGTVGGLFYLLMSRLTHHNANPDESSPSFVINIVPVLLVGAIVGATGGATIMQKVLRQKSSFWKALLGTFLGLLVGWVLCLPVLFALQPLLGPRLEGAWEFVTVGLIICSSMVAGTVIGSGWKAKGTDAKVLENDHLINGSR